MKDGKTVAIVPGSFDPITYGHIDIAKRAAQLYDTVYLAVMINDQKKYIFTIEQRERIARAALCDACNVRVISSRGMLWKLAEELSADAIVKGYRNQADYEYEQKMAEFNAEKNPLAKTVLLKADSRYSDLSSTAVREKMKNNDSLDGMLPKTAIDEICAILSQRKNN
ncbi:MAG: pantetheine-phosphate adenylyltransferase [Ruminococcaceae bacterium]|nr:pantetheine-phosphate adenylyltransferase [Oscillospiraceae bacterium]